MQRHLKAVLGRTPGIKGRSGQSMVEFALAAPVFLLFVFGIIQVALIIRAYDALAQAATDGAHVTAAQASTLPSNLANSWQADMPALQAIRAALTSQNLSGIVSIDIASVDASGNTIAMPVTNSVDLNTTLSITQTVPLQNSYSYSPGGNGACQVDQFNLTNSAHGLNSQFNTCALRWNDEEYDPKTNQNGRNDQRCTENTVKVRIAYHYATISFPVHYDITLVAQDSTILEPRQFLGNSANFQSTVSSC